MLGDVVGKVSGGDSAFAGGVGGGVEFVKLDVADKRKGLLELGMGFAAEPHYDIGAYGNAGDALADFVDDAAVFVACVAAPHIG